MKQFAHRANLPILWSKTSSTFTICPMGKFPLALKTSPWQRHGSGPRPKGRGEWGFLLCRSARVFPAFFASFFLWATREVCCMAARCQVGAMWVPCEVPFEAATAQRGRRLCRRATSLLFLHCWLKHAVKIKLNMSIKLEFSNLLGPGM